MARWAVLKTVRYGLAVALFTACASAAIDLAPEGRVRFYNMADSDFDAYSGDPAPADAEWMRSHYARMQTYSPYFDSRLSWYPDAWVYQDSYAIRPDWPVFREHPEWVLRDARGRLLYIDWGCSGGSCPQYAADVGNPAFRAWWIARARDLVRIGYRGIFVDDVNLDWRFSNGVGTADAVDPRTGRAMTLEGWRGYFALFMEELRAALPAAEIAHNSIWYAGSPDDPLIRRQVDAADFINLERGASDPGLVGGGGRWGFETFLAFIDEVHRRGRAVVLMDFGTTLVQREYGLAAWFLISSGRDLMSSDQLAWTAPGHWWRGYALDLGRALGNRYAWKNLLRRDFECGIVLLNQPQAAGRRVDLGRTYLRMDGSAVRELSLPAATAAILQTCTVSP